MALCRSGILWINSSLSLANTNALPAVARCVMFWIKALLMWLHARTVSLGFEHHSKHSFCIFNWNAWWCHCLKHKCCFLEFLIFILLCVTWWWPVSTYLVNCIWQGSLQIFFLPDKIPRIYLRKVIFLGRIIVLMNFASTDFFVNVRKHFSVMGAIEPWNRLPRVVVKSIGEML